MLIRVLVTCFSVFLCTSAYGAGLETVIVAPSKPIQAGQKVKFDMYFTNPSNSPIQLNPQKQLKCRLFSDHTILEGVLAQDLIGSPSPIVIPANGFRKDAYFLVVPEHLKGHVALELVEFESNRAMFVVQAAPSPPKKAEAGASAGKDTLLERFQPYVSNLSAYEPVYFTVGTDPEKSKFQLSFKYRFLNVKGALAQRLPWVTNFYLGYTQTSLWDLKSDSKPFEDTSYKPELFFLSQNIDLGVPWISFFGVQTGFQHESNGRGGDASRNTNYIYAKPIFMFDLGGDYHFKVAPKTWIYVDNDDDTNPNLEDYRGYFDLELKFGKPDNFVLGSNLRWGSEGGSIQMEFTYPLNRICFKNLDLYFYVQYFNGYAETLLNYTEKRDAFRIGLAIVR